jgi:hypothetical protein
MPRDNHDVSDFHHRRLMVEVERLSTSCDFLLFERNGLSDLPELLR